MALESTVGELHSARASLRTSSALSTGFTDEGDIKGRESDCEDAGAICTTKVKNEVAMSSAIFFDETSLDLIVRGYRGGTGHQHFNYYCIARDPDDMGVGSDSRVLL